MREAGIKSFLHWRDMLTGFSGDSVIAIGPTLVVQKMHVPGYYASADSPAWLAH